LGTIILNPCDVELAMNKQMKMNQALFHNFAVFS